MRAYWLLPVILGLPLVAGGVHAQQKYPTKPIRLIVPFPPGGGVDIVSRTVGEKSRDAGNARFGFHISPLHETLTLHAADNPVHRA